MGAWSAEIFDDDDAADIIDEYKILLGYGMSPPGGLPENKQLFLSGL